MNEPISRDDSPVALLSAPRNTASRKTALGTVTAGRETLQPHRSRPRGYVAKWTPQPKTLVLLGQIDNVLEEYADHWPLTVRQIFYRLVGAFGYPKTEKAYSNLCELMVTARRAHRLPFEAIRDDGVSTYAVEQFADTDDFRREVAAMAGRYRRDKLARQPRHIELWCEAGGMQPQLHKVAEPFSVPVYSSGGFDSLTSKYDLAQRIIAVGKPAVVLHVGDLDPSGVALFDAVAADVTAFVLADRKYNNVRVDFVRVALTPGQVAAFDLPTAPAKASSHALKWGDAPTCQLEALAPDELAEIVRAAILAHLDEDVLAGDELAEVRERRELTRLLPAPREDAR